LSKLLVALIATAFALGLASALADDKTPAQLTPEEKAAVKKAKRAERDDWTPYDRRIMIEGAKKKAKRAERQKQLSQEALGDDKTPHTLEGGFGPLGGWPEQKARRDALEKERAAKKQMDKGSGQ
jgi:hypothetical protein